MLALAEPVALADDCWPRFGRFGGVEGRRYEARAVGFAGAATAGADGVGTASGAGFHGRAASAHKTFGENDIVISKLMKIRVRKIE